MTDPLPSTPRADGFRMPAEWALHSGCWIAWPERPDNWRDGAAPAQRAFAEVAAAIAESEPVTMAVSPPQLERARALLPPTVRVVELETDDAWMRDIGPTFLLGENGERRGVDWSFNAWGGLYQSWERDDLAASTVIELEGAQRYRAPFILEGGSIHVDGEGTVIATEECLLNPNRNPGMTREEIETALHEHLGTEKALWLGRGIHNDETDGHVDNLACFVAPGTVLLAWTDDRDDPQHEISADALRRLREATDARGRRLDIALVPLPGPLYATAEEAAGVEPVAGTLPRRAGDRLAASYVNFYLGNSRIVMPLLDERFDETAAVILRDCFPDREVVGVPAREILLGGGSIHCITQQVPACASDAGLDAPSDAPGVASTAVGDLGSQQTH
jgi:agmatine deiminase